MTGAHPWCYHAASVGDPVRVHRLGHDHSRADLAQTNKKDEFVQLLKGSQALPRAARETLRPVQSRSSVLLPLQLPSMKVVLFFHWGADVDVVVVVVVVVDDDDAYVVVVLSNPLSVCPIPHPLLCVLQMHLLPLFLLLLLSLLLDCLGPL